MSLDLQLRTRQGEGKFEDAAKKLRGTFEAQYQRWYSESLEVVRQLLPARQREFESLYKGEGRRKQIQADTYTIQDWLLGVVPHLTDYRDRRRSMTSPLS